MNIDKYENTIQKEMGELKLLLYKKNSEKKDLEMVIDAIESKMVRTIRKMFVPWTGEKLEQAHRQQGEKLKKDRPVYEGIKSNFQAWIFEVEDQKKVKLLQIIPCGYEHYVFNLIFTFEGFKFQLKVPNVSVCNADNIERMDYGQYSLLYEVKGHWRYIDTSYNLDDISESIYEFVKENKDKEK